MKRPLTLSAFIIGTVFCSFYTIMIILSITMVSAVLDAAGAGYAAGAVYGVLVVELLFMVASLVLNAIAITAWNKDAEGYNKKKGVIIAAVVLNFISIAFYFVSSFMDLSGIAMAIIAMITLIVTNVLALIDLANEKKRIAQATAVTPDTEVKEEATATTEETKTEE